MRIFSRRLTGRGWSLFISAGSLFLPAHVSAIDSHMCADSATGTTPCTIPAITFVSGTQSLSGISGVDVVFVDAGQTASIPNQTFYNFGTLKNFGTFYNGDGTTDPWWRIMGPGALFENFGVANNLSSIYVQDNSVLEANAPTGAGVMHNHVGGTFNNGSSTIDSRTGRYLYGGIDGFDAAVINNDGTFNNYAYVAMGSGQALNNSGVFVNYAPPYPPFGSQLSLEGTIENSGTFLSVAAAQVDIGGVFSNKTSGQLIIEGRYRSSAYSAGDGNLFNDGSVEVKATATGLEPNFYSPGNFVQSSSGTFVIDGVFVESLFDIGGGTVIGGGTLDTTHSNVPGSAPTVVIHPEALLNPGNGTDNEMQIVGDVRLEGTLSIELAGGGAGGVGQGTLYDHLKVTPDTSIYRTSLGYIQLGGTLDVQLSPGFAAQVGDYFDIITADGGVTGNFTSPSTFNVSGYSFAIATVGTSVRLEVVGVDADSDLDGIPDAGDNCSAVVNPNQRDTDSDGYGNLCDADLNNSGYVDNVDLALFRQRFITVDADADLNGDNVVNNIDLALFKQRFLSPPGPSGLHPPVLSATPR